MKIRQTIVLGAGRERLTLELRKIIEEREATLQKANLLVRGRRIVDTNCEHVWTENMERPKLLLDNPQPISDGIQVNRMYQLVSDTQSDVRILAQEFLGQDPVTDVKIELIRVTASDEILLCISSHNELPVCSGGIYFRLLEEIRQGSSDLRAKNTRDRLQNWLEKYPFISEQQAPLGKVLSEIRKKRGEKKIDRH